MKKLFYLLLLAPLCACNNGQTAQGDNSADSLVAELEITDENGEPKFPEGVIPMYCLGDGTAIFVYDGEKDSINIAPIINDFKTLYDGKKNYPIECVGAQNGFVGYGTLIGNSDYYDNMNGVRYKISDGDVLWSDCFAVTDKFAKENNIVSVDDEQDADDCPSELTTMLEEKYGKITRICKCAVIDNGKATLYGAQFEPTEESCMAVIVLVEGDKTYIFEDPCEIYPGEGPNWHVDDEGEYAMPSISMAVRTGKGLILFFTEVAPESTCYGMIYTDGEELKDKSVVSYYNYIDYCGPEE